MAFDFPSSPTLGQQFVAANGLAYTYNGYGWAVAGTVPPILNLLATRTVVSGQTTVDFSGLLDASYDEYEIHYFGVRPVNDLNTMAVQISQSGAYITTANYGYNLKWTSSTPGEGVGGTIGAVFMPVGLAANLSNNAAAHAAGTVAIFRPSDSVTQKAIIFQCAQTLSTGGSILSTGSGQFSGNLNPIDGIRFTLNSGGFATGTFKLFGVGQARAASPPSGSRILIESKTVSAAVANVDFVTGIDATYDEYELVFMGVKLATDGANFGLRISQDGGATFKAGATDYYWEGVYINNTVANSAFISNNTGSTLLRLSTAVLLNAAIAMHGKAKFFRPWASGERKFYMYESICAQQTQGNAVEYGGGQYGTDNNPFNAVRLIASSGNITAGTFNLYGTKK